MVAVAFVTFAFPAAKFPAYAFVDVEFWKFALFAVRPDDEAVTAPPATFTDVDALSEPIVEVPIIAVAIVADVVAVIVPTISVPIVAFDAKRDWMNETRRFESEAKKLVLVDWVNVAEFA